MKYVTPEYNEKLKELADILCVPEKLPRVDNVSCFVLETSVLFEDYKITDSRYGQEVIK